MQEHDSTQKCDLGPREDTVPGSTRLQGLLPAPHSRDSVSGGRQGLPGKTCFTSFVPRGDTHALLGEGGDGDGEGGGAVIYFFGHHPVSSGGQGSLFVNTPLPGSPGGRRKEQGGEGMKEQNSGVQIPAGIL